MIDGEATVCHRLDLFQKQEYWRATPHLETRNWKMILEQEIGTLSRKRLRLSTHSMLNYVVPYSVGIESAEDAPSRAAPGGHASPGLIRRNLSLHGIAHGGSRPGGRYWSNGRNARPGPPGRQESCKAGSLRILPRIRM
ncbi:unnamed protein product [Nesidiocoris tenuis]|uniref:Uncharacterized protein n=1 Tax=Nesidiocoris tenuis TaxID=355587 RepID=A0A6H5G275_9HEMI|nr:unnamed protein product [Nesidiocoris tenuis]